VPLLYFSDIKGLLDVSEEVGILGPLEFEVGLLEYRDRFVDIGKSYWAICRGGSVTFGHLRSKNCSIHLVKNFLYTIFLCK
jgi:hypothetical protein